jgi:hypothetical protein
MGCSPHTIAALENTFKSAEALRIARKREVHNTPKYGSWLNIVGIELSAFGREYLNRRILLLKPWNTRLLYKPSETLMNPQLISGSPPPMTVSIYVVSIPHIQND